MTKIIRGSVVLMALAIALIGIASVEESQGESPLSLGDLSWMVGIWRGEGLGGICEEAWNAPSAGTMIGTFKLMVEGAPQLYEFMAIVPDSAGWPVYHVKHFGADLTGWEEKDKTAKFRYISSSANEVTFGGLHYRYAPPDSLTIVITMTDKDKSPWPETIHLRRVLE